MLRGWSPTSSTRQSALQNCLLQSNIDDKGSQIDPASAIATWWVLFLTLERVDMQVHQSCHFYFLRLHTTASSLGYCFCVVIKISSLIYSKCFTTQFKNLHTTWYSVLFFAIFAYCPHGMRTMRWMVTRIKTLTLTECKRWWWCWARLTMLLVILIMSHRSRVSSRPYTLVLPRWQPWCCNCAFTRALGGRTPCYLFFGHVLSVASIGSCRSSRSANNRANSTCISTTCHLGIEEVTTTISSCPCPLSWRRQWRNCSGVTIDGWH